MNVPLNPATGVSAQGNCPEEDHLAAISKIPLGCYQQPQARVPFHAGRISEEIVSIIIPAYNEYQYLEELLRRVLAAPLPVGLRRQLVLVDDGSEDCTREILRQFEGHPEISILYHAQNRGKGAAIRTALQHAVGEYVLIQDADLELDPEDYPALLEPLVAGHSNVVYGVRAEHPERGLMLFLGTKFLTALTNFLYRANIHDEATCYKVFRRSVLERIRLNCKGFEFCPEVTSKVLRIGEAIAEVPVAYDPRTNEQGKKLRWIDGLRAIWVLFRYRLEPRAWFERNAPPGGRTGAVEESMSLL